MSRAAGEVDIWRTDPASRLFLALAVGTLQSLRRMYWRVRRPKASGVHVLPVRPDGRLVLVKLTYARGWRIPGGGRHQGETAEDAAAREAGEEIGATGWSRLRPICQVEHEPDFRRCTSSLFVMEEVVYRPHWSVEIEAVGAFPPHRLPSDLSELAREWIARIRQSGALGGAVQQGEE